MQYNLYTLAIDQIRKLTSEYLVSDGKSCSIKFKQ